MDRDDSTLIRMASCVNECSRNWIMNIYSLLDVQICTNTLKYVNFALQNINSYFRLFNWRFEAKLNRFMQFFSE